MKVEEREFVSDASGIIESTNFQIANEDIPMMFDILRSGLYSNKPLAVLREYACNAYDSHVDVDAKNLSEGIVSDQKSVPIQITMPTAFEPFLKIRDFGTGLTHEGVMKVYSSYGKSTKRNTDEQIGQLGIGSKSAFCYADEFTISSYVDGKLNIYSAHIDETGLGMIDQIASDVDTDECNGVEITVRVKPSDINRFENEAMDFFKTFNPKPIFVNNTKVHDYVHGYVQDSIIEGAGWALVTCQESYDPKVSVRMGNITYPFDLSYLDRVSTEQCWVLKNYRMELKIDAKIGDVKFVASREALEYKDKTVQFVCNKIEAIFNEMRQDIENDIAQAPNLWSARSILKKRNNVLGHINFKPLYRGVPIDSLFVSVEALKDNRISVKKLDQKRRFSSGYSIDPSEDCVLFLDRNTVGDPVVKARIRQWITQFGVKGQTYYILSGKTEDIDQIVSHDELIGAKTVEVNSIKLITQKTSKKSNPAQAARAKVAVFKFKGTSSYPYAYNWEPAEIDASTDAVYVNIKNFKPLNHTCGTDDLFDLQQTIEQCENLTGASLTIYGVRENADVPVNWVTLKNHIKSLVLEHAKNPEIVQAREYRAVTVAMGNSSFANTLLHCPEIHGSGELAKYMGLCVEKSVSPELKVLKKAESLSLLAIKSDVTLDPAAEDFVRMQKMVEDKYGLLKLLNYNRGLIKHFEVYVKAVDAMEISS